MGQLRGFFRLDFGDLIDDRPQFLIWHTWPAAAKQDQDRPQNRAEKCSHGELLPVGWTDKIKHGVMHPLYDDSNLTPPVFESPGRCPHP